MIANILIIVEAGFYVRRNLAVDVLLGKRRLEAIIEDIIQLKNEKNDPPL